MLKALLSSLLILVLSVASAGASTKFQKKQAHHYCYNNALILKQMATRRDAGAPQDYLINMVIKKAMDAEVAGAPFPTDVVNRVINMIKTAYLNKGLTPDLLAVAYYKLCMKQKSKVTA